MAVPNYSDTQVFNQLNSGHAWSGATITYRFPTSTSGVTISGGEGSAFRAPTSAQQSLFTLALQTWDDLIAPNMVATSATSSNIEFAYTTTGIEFAHAYYPTAGSVWFNGSEADLVNPAVGTYGFLTTIHEIGHALGLNHMGDYNGEGSWAPSSYQDSVVLSVMSYFGPNAALRSNDVANADWRGGDGKDYTPQTPMLNDVMVIQQIYGTSTTTRTDDTVYGFGSNIAGTMAAIYDFNSNRHPILTLFDAGGNDTLNLSGWSTRSDIKLEPGAYSSANDMTNNIAIAYSASIENAVGGGGNDTITGNALANRLDGGAGNDVISGLDGNDILVGGNDNDQIDGGAGDDTAVLSGNFASYTFNFDAISRLYTAAGASSGTDTFSNVEFFQFADVLRSANQLLGGTSGGDTTAPVLSSTSPADNATGVAVAANLVLTFSETVQAGSGNIVIFNANGSVARTIAATDTSQVSVAGSVVTINPTTDLSAGSGYYVTLAAGTFNDQAGNPFAGLAGSTAFNFSTAAIIGDTTAPVLSSTSTSPSTSPADNATGVAVNANLVLNFSETVQAGSGSIVIFNEDGSVARSIAVGDTSQVTFSGSSVTINPSADLAAGSNYYVNLTSGVIRDTAGNAFAGISSSTALNFRTANATQADDFPMTAATTGVVVVDAAGTAGMINFVDDGDLFRVSLTAGQSYVFRVNSTGLPDPLLALYDTDGTYLTFADDSTDSLNAELIFTANKTGSYFLAAFDAGSGLGGYTVSAARSGDDYPWDTSTTGVVTVGGSASSGVINSAGDADLFKVVLSAGTSYTFELQRSASAGLTDPYLYLYGPDVTELAYDDDSGGSGNARISFTASSSGTYYLGAMDYDVGTGGYSLSARIGSSGSSSVATEGPDQLIGTSAADVINGLGGNDSIQGGTGNDRIDGGTGTDHAYYEGMIDEYLLSWTASGGVTVLDQVGSEGTDTLSNIERLEFLDVGLALDMGSSQSGGESALILGAWLGAAALNELSLVSAVLDYFDSGASLLDGSNLLVDAGLVALFAGGSDNWHLVQLVYFNLYGNLAGTSTMNTWLSQLDRGDYSQAEFLAAAALSTANQSNVDLVGLAANGMYYV